MHIMITGHLGFVGAETCRLFAAHDISVVGYDLMEGLDIRDSKQFDGMIEFHRPHCILHLAAISRIADSDRDPRLAFETNVDGTRNVTTAAAKYHIPLVYASSGSAIMPLDGYERPYIEAIPARGNSVYGCTKALGEYIVATHTPHIILRYAHLYGKEKRGHGLVSNFVSRIERGLQPVLYGGEQVADFCYVKDIAQANLLAVTATWEKWNAIYHIGSGHELRAAEAARLICDKLGYTGKLQVGERRAIDKADFCFDISKARAILGYEPAYSFEAGLEDMLK